MATIQIIQIIALLLFIIGSCLYYNIRRELHRNGYPVSLFVYSGPCWNYYRDLIDKSDMPTQKKLIARKRIMSFCLIAALTLLILSGFIPTGN